MSGAGVVIKEDQRQKFFKVYDSASHVSLAESRNNIVEIFWSVGATLY